MLFRNGTEQNNAVIVDEDSASAQVMMTVFGDMSLQEVVGEHKAFINFTEGLLLRENRPFFPKKQVIVEVLENVTVTPKLMSTLGALKKEGFVIALDDYVFNPELEPLEAYADIIKIDILKIGPKKMLEHIGKLKAKGILLLAEKVETREQFDFCKRIGFDYFQGYFFAKPKIIKGQCLPANKLTVLSLLANVYNCDVDINILSRIIGQDVSLTQKLLKLASAEGVLVSPISSIHDAVVRFGLNRLKSWVGLLILSRVDDKPTELLKTSLVRAKFCELVGKKVGGISQESYFVVGLFSTLDAVMDSCLEDLLVDIQFDDAIKQALLENKGALGEALSAVQSMERARVDFKHPGDLSASDLSSIYLEAIGFSESVDLGA